MPIPVLSVPSLWSGIPPSWRTIQWSKIWRLHSHKSHHPLQLRKTAQFNHPQRSGDWCFRSFGRLLDCVGCRAIPPHTMHVAAMFFHGVALVKLICVLWWWWWCCCCFWSSSVQDLLTSSPSVDSPDVLVRKPRLLVDARLQEQDATALTSELVRGALPPSSECTFPSPEL